MVFNPCWCGCSLQTGTQIIAAIRMFFAGLDILIGVPLYMTDYVALHTAIIISIVGLIVFFLSAVLYQGALEKNVQKCFNWLFANIGIFLARLVVQILYAVTRNVPQGILITTAFGFLWDLHCMLVVHCFINQLQRINDDSGSLGEFELVDRY